MNCVIHKKALLTLDDSPSRTMKKRIDYLLEQKIPAVFFCRGDFLEKRQEQVIYAIKKGFIIGNHGFSHTRFSEFNLDEVKNEIEKTDNLLENVYKKAGVERQFKLFRFPYGDRGNGVVVDVNSKELIRAMSGNKVNAIQEILFGLGYEKDLFWTVETLEWVLFKNYNKYNLKNESDVIKRIENFLENSNSDEIILIHDHDENLTFFPRIIEAYLRLGVDFKSFNKFF